MGNGTTTYDSPVPVPVTGLGSGVRSITASNNHTCAVTTGGAAKCWGSNGYGQLGNGTATDSKVPVPVTGLGSGVTSITAGDYHTCAVTTGGAAKCWGDNWYGQLGNGTRSDSTVPVAVTGLGSGVTSITASTHHACAVTTGGAAKCWGTGYVGQLGDGTTTRSNVPVPVTGLSSGVALIAAGGWHTCAMTTGGAAKCWGANYYGQLGNGTRSDSAVPVAVRNPA